jgi:thiol-disulfide isomerase/thioredoxin
MNIILFQSDNCGYCHIFYPVFKYSKQKLTNYNFIKYNVLNDEDKIDKLKNKYPNLFKEDVLVPTVFIEHNNKLVEIPTVMPEDTNKDNIIKAFKKFKSNIENVLNKIDSNMDNKLIKYKVNKYEYKLKNKNIDFVKKEPSKETYKYLKNLYHKNTH